MFKRVLLTSFHNLEPTSGLYALAALATYVRPHVDGVRVVDACRQNLHEIIEEFKPDLIGIPSYTVHHHDVVEQAMKLKQRYPEIKLLLGGYHVTSMPTSFDEPFDYAILGEAEETLRKLVMGQATSLDNIIIRGRKRIIKDVRNAVNVEKLPVVDLPNLTPREFYANGSVGMVTSRGCSFTCKYCAIRSMSTGMRYRDVSIVVDEIEYFYKELGARTITFWDDIFGVNTPWLKNLISELRNRGLLGKVRYAIHVRATTVTDARCTLWKELGVFRWNMGLDFGSDEMLKKVKGGNSTVQKNKEAILLGGKYGFEIGASIIFGGPEETLENMEETLKFLEWFGDQKHVTQLIHPESNMWGFVAVPLPDTEWWDWGIANGKFTADINLKRLSLDNWKDHLLLNDDVTEEQFEAVRNQAAYHLVRIIQPGGKPFKLVPVTSTAPPASPHRLAAWNF